VPVGGPGQAGSQGRWQGVGGYAWRQREANDGRLRVPATQGRGGALSDYAAGGQDRDPVSQPLGFLHVVRGQEDRLAEVPQPGDDIPG
jgi:hypothetical protein